MALSSFLLALQTRVLSFRTVLIRARTNISSPEFLQKELKRNWETANEFKSTYPNTYFADFEKGVTICLSLARPKERICEVIADMEDAVIGLKPKVSYFPGISAKMFNLLFSLAPVSFIDYITTFTVRPLHADGKSGVLDLLHDLVSNNRN